MADEKLAVDQVMQQLGSTCHSCLTGAAAGGRPSVSCPVPFSTVMSSDSALASKMMSSWMRLSGMVLAYMQQQEDPGILPDTRLWLRLDAAPVHHATIPELLQAVTDLGPHMASFAGVVQAQTTIMEHVYSRTMTCPDCGAEVRVLSGKEFACACGSDAAFEWAEVQQHRVVMSMRHISLSTLGCTATRGAAPDYHLHPHTVQVLLHDDLATHPAVRVGAPLLIIGRVSLEANARAVAKASSSPIMCHISITANAVQPARPHAPWLSLSLASEAAIVSGQHNIELADLVSSQSSQAQNALHASLACFSPFTSDNRAPFSTLHSALTDVHGFVPDLLSLGLFVSVALAGTAMQQLQQLPDPSDPAAKPSTLTARSVSLLVLHEATDPMPIRTLRAVAQLLCPHSIAPTGGAGSAEGLPLPHVEKWDGTDTKLEVGSTVTSCNAGVLVLESGLPGLKSTQLLQAVDILVSSDKATYATAEIAVPMTATLWAAQSHLATGQPQKASDKYTLPMQQFSIVLLFEMDTETAMDSVLASYDAESPGAEAQVAACTAELRHHMALVSKMPLVPTISEEGLKVLQAYVQLVQHQGTDASSTLPAVLISTLAAIARGCARLLLHHEVQAHPDCTVAILLVERSLVAKLGGEYPEPMHLVLGTEGCLDTRLQAVRDHIMRQLEPYFDSHIDMDDEADD